jgi:hypothetical protein
MHIPDAVTALERDLRGIFGQRLQSMVVYGLRAQQAQRDAQEAHAGDGSHGVHGGDHRVLTHTLAVVDTLSTDDLRACTAHVERWQDRGLDTPLLVAAHEFGRSLDVFPFEFGGILADHLLVSGRDPFDDLRVEPADQRRACEVQARGHLLHLREGYLETRGRADALAVLIVQSAPAFAALLTSVAHLDAIEVRDGAAAARHVERRLELPPGAATAIVALVGIDEIPSAEADRLFAPYLDTVGRLVTYIDCWTRG